MNNPSREFHVFSAGWSRTRQTCPKTCPRRSALDPKPANTTQLEKREPLGKGTEPATQSASRIVEWTCRASPGPSAGAGPQESLVGRRGITATRTTHCFGARGASAWCCAPGFEAIVSGAPRPPVPADLPRRRERARTKIGAVTSLPPKTNRSRRVSRCAQSTPQEARSGRRQLRGLPRSAHQASFDDR